MKCPPFDQLVDIGRSRGELQTSMDPTMAHHIENCNSCREKLQEQIDLTSMLRSLAAEARHAAPSKTLLLKLVQRQPETGYQRFVSGLRFWRLAAVLALLVIGGAFLFPTSDPVEDARNGTIQEAATPFIPLVHGDIPVDSMQVIRVELPRTTLLEFGYPMNESRSEDPIEADVIITQDGLPQAIRFVNFQQ